MAQIAFDARVDLIALGNSQSGIETSRKVSIQNSKLPNEIRIRAQCLREANVRPDETASLLRGHLPARKSIAQRVGVEEELLLTEREVVDRTQERPVEEESSAKPEDEFRGRKGRISDGYAWSEVVWIVENRFSLVTQSVTQEYARMQLPFVLKEETGVGILLCRRALKVLPVTVWDTGEEIASARKIKRARKVS